MHLASEISRVFNQLSNYQLHIYRYGYQAICCFMTFYLLSHNKECLWLYFFIFLREIHINYIYYLYVFSSMIYLWEYTFKYYCQTLRKGRYLCPLQNGSMTWWKSSDGYEQHRFGCCLEHFGRSEFVNCRCISTETIM